MVESIRVALCQIRPVVGDLAGNAEKIVDAHATSVAAGATVSVFPELALCGLVPRDLLLRDDFVAACHSTLEDLRGRLDPAGSVVIGMPVRGEVLAGRVTPGHVTPDGPTVPGRPPRSGARRGSRDAADRLLHDAVVVITAGRIETFAAKSVLDADSPNQDLRYFAPGPNTSFTTGGVEVLVAVGDELEAVTTAGHGSPAPGSSTDPVARLVLNPVASPFTIGSGGRLAHTAARVAVRTGLPVVVVNGVGGNDRFVFDGGSVAVEATGRTLVESSRFVETVDVVDLPLIGPESPGAVSGQVANGVVGTKSADAGPTDRLPGTAHDAPPAGRAGSPDWDRIDLGDLWAALVTGIRDYVDLNGFPAVGLGLSGGVDSALVATLAAEAVGPERVNCVMMPSRYSSEGSVTDATELATNLGVRTHLVPIDAGHVAFEEMLSGPIGGELGGLTDENLQARIRGMVLMALSNEFGWLILVGSNRSEARVGYSTLYGDSAGGLAPISDIDKLGVYALCRWYNERCVAEGSGALIPETILTKAPSAELRPDQRDDQSLPPYEVLDPLLGMYLDERRSRSELVEAGFDGDLVERVTGLVDRSEYKRQQMPPGIIVSRPGPAYRRDLPITSRWRP